MSTHEDHPHHSMWSPRSSSLPVAAGALDSCALPCMRSLVLRLPTCAGGSGTTRGRVSSSCLQLVKYSITSVTTRSSFNRFSSRLHGLRVCLAIFFLELVALRTLNCVLGVFQIHPIT